MFQPHLAERRYDFWRYPHLHLGPPHVAAVAATPTAPMPPQRPMADLYVAFDLIGQGMTYEQVRDIIGSEYNAGKDDYQGTEVHFKWKLAEAVRITCSSR